MNYKLLAPALLGALLASACGKKAEAPQSEAASPAASAPEAAASPARSSETPPPLPEELAGPAPKITVVRPRWVVADSELAAEIVLQGEHFSAVGTVDSGSPLLKVMRLERAATQVTVFAELDLGAPAGDYELQYLAPGREPIPFKLRYDGRKKP